MSIVDAAWLQMDRPTNPMVVNVLLSYERSVDPHAVRTILEERIAARFPRFRQRVGRDLLGRPRWEDDGPFDVDRHLHRLALPAPGDREALQQLIGDLVSVPLDRGKPLWDLYMIDGYGHGCALLVRVHHCVGDGVALSQALGPLVGVDSQDAFALPAPGANGRGALGRLPLAGLASSGWHGAEGFLRAGAATALHPARLPGAAAQRSADMEALARLLAGRTDAHGPLKREPGMGQRVAWSRPLPLADLKRSARDADATVNDLLVTAVSGALGRYLRARGAGIDELHAVMPINLRPLDRPLPRELGNRFGLLIVALPVGIRGQRKRLAAVKQTLNALKRSRQAPVSFAILGALGLTPAQLEAPAVDFFTAKATLVLTNVVGPPTPLQTAGTELAGVLVWAPCSGNLGISVTMLSYSGQVSIGLLTDGGLVPHPDRLVDRIETELHQLTAG
ncbi:MAG: wax ester/triacylglycerol synthase family O-acyltransferase [Nocardioidaceae bacterium]